MTLIQIAATLGVGRSSLVRALAQAPDSSGDSLDVGVGPDQTAIKLPEQVTSPAESVEQQPPSVPVLGPAPEVRLLGRTARRGGEELEAITWPAGHSPACPSCAHPTTGMEEQFARVPGLREPVVVALAQPCGCLVDDHVAALQAGLG